MGGALTVTTKCVPFGGLTVAVHGGVVLVSPAQTVTLHCEPAQPDAARLFAHPTPFGVQGNELWIRASAAEVAACSSLKPGLAGRSFAPARAAASVTFWRLRLKWVETERSVAMAIAPMMTTKKSAISGIICPRSPRRRRNGRRTSGRLPRGLMSGPLGQCARLDGLGHR